MVTWVAYIPDLLPRNLKKTCAKSQGSILAHFNPTLALLGSMQVFPSSVPTTNLAEKAIAMFA